MPDIVEKKKRERSPNYPAFGLSDAIARLGVFYKREGKGVSPRDVAVTAWGYASSSGSALRTLSALNQYGLLESGGGGVRISDLGLKILLPKDAEEKAEAIKQSANMPKIFNEILQECGGHLPSEESLVANLVRNKDFSPGAAKTCIHAMMDTFELARFENYDNVGVSEGESDRPIGANDSMQDHVAQHIKRSKTGEWSKVFTWPLSESTTAMLSISGERPSVEDIALLEDYLEIAKKALTRDGTKPSE